MSVNKGPSCTDRIVAGVALGAAFAALHPILTGFLAGGMISWTLSNAILFGCAGFACGAAAGDPYKACSEMQWMSAKELKIRQEAKKAMETIYRMNRERMQPWRE